VTTQHHTSFEENDHLYDQVYGGWLGKTIGGTLGMPYEGIMQLLDVHGYDASLTLPAANDDLDLQLVNLHALEQYGPRLQATQLGQEWIEHVFFPFDEYGYALANLRRGLLPPLAGWFNNPFIDCMGAPIRSELWAMLTPGQPQIAAHYAWQDALVDHAGGEGAYGEVFFTTIECLAFVEHDRDRLIACGLQAIPEDCRVSQAVRHVLACASSDMSWQQTRESVLTHFGHPNFTDAPQNVAFTIIGWLYGHDFADAVLIAINCGYDTDCTGATLGAILGIISGASALPHEWRQPVGNRVIVSDPIRFLDAPTTLEELTERTLRVAQETQAFWQQHLSSRSSRTSLTGEQDAPPSITWPQYTETRAHDDTVSLAITFQDQHPAIAPGQTKALYISITNPSTEPWQGTLELCPPTGWTTDAKTSILLPPQTTHTFTQSLTADDSVQPAYQVMLHLTRTYAGTAWHSLTLPIALLPTRHWSISTRDHGSTRQITVPGDTVHLPSSFSDYSGIIEISTTLYTPIDRALRLVVIAPSPVEVWLDDQHILHTTASPGALPTLHRPEDGSFCDCFIPVGHHRLALRISNTQHKNQAITVVAASAIDGSEPGPYYYLTDLLFL
jgi:ADP-ribosylglycohydrolase